MKASILSHVYDCKVKPEIQYMLYPRVVVYINLEAVVVVMDVISFLSIPNKDLPTTLYMLIFPDSVMV